MEIKVTGKLIPTPRQPANIYRLTRPTVTERSIRALARQLGIQADAKSGTLCIDQDKLTYQHEHLELTVFRASGAMRLIDRFRWQVDDLESDLEIEDATARRLGHESDQEVQDRAGRGDEVPEGGTPSRRSGKPGGNGGLGTDDRRRHSDAAVRQ
jgi:hypothetical protein